MTSDLLGISISGLRVSQSALSTTGHNISNAGVQGYSRQVVNVVTNPATPSSVGFMGNGANVNDIQRIADDFINLQLRTDTSLFAGLESYFDNISQLDSLLADESTGLASAMESFFAAMQNGADDPTSIPARQLIISESENLADRFNTIYSRFESINTGVDTAIETSVSQINALVSNIAELNLKITDAIGLTNGQQPNDLLDQRDEAIRKLSEFVDVQTFEEGLGAVNVVIASGENLVIGNEYRELEATLNESDPSKFDVVVKGDVSTNNVTNLITGGELGGLLQFQNTVMDNAFNELGKIAVVMADTFNQIHSQGLTLNDDFGGNFFFDVNNSTAAENRVIGKATNAAPQDRIVSLNIADSSALQTSDYDVSIVNGGLVTVTRLSDGQEVASELLTGAYPQAVSFDGLELVLEDGSFQAGDEFRLQPFRAGARDFSASVVDPSDIAFASPILTDASLSNTGTGKISAGEIASLVDANGEPLPLFTNPGEFSPPLGIVFTSDTTYDVLDFSDPANPTQLDPPIRNQVYIVGADEPIFSSDPSGTLVTTAGAAIGLPNGTSAVTSAAIMVGGAVPPNYAVTDFSATNNQFSFDIVVSGTAAGINDGTTTVTFSTPAVADDDALVSSINGQLAGSNVSAYITDAGTLGFRLNDAGYGDITVQNYNADPDGNGDNAPAGQANTLFGFDIEGSIFTTIADADGQSGDGELNNRYPPEVITITQPSPIAGQPDITQNIFTGVFASARETASLLNNQPGVSANAFNTIELSNFQGAGAYPLQIELNGQPLIPHEFDPGTGVYSVNPDVPDPATEPNAFYSYLAEQINSNSTLDDRGVYAQATTDPTTGYPRLQVSSSQGDDLQVSFVGSAGESIDVSDGTNDNLSLVGSGNGVETSIVIGGKIDISLDEGVTLETFPSTSLLFGDTSDPNFAQSIYLGIQASISGVPKAGDVFTIDFNHDAASDNRNALNMVDLSLADTMNGGTSSYSDSYASLVEIIGIDTSSTRINKDASEQVLVQSTSLRDSISAVNLDEEASNLIKFEQIYSANAQVINVARDLFDRLLNAF